MSKLGRSEWRSANEEADPVLAVTPVQEQTLQSSKANATAARLEGDFRAAADSYRKATELEPTIPEQWANLGLMDSAGGKSSKAIQSFNQAICLEPSLLVLHLSLGTEHLDAGNSATALPYRERAEMHP